MSRVWKIPVVVLAVALMLSFGVISARAQTTVNDSPETAAVIDGQTHVAPVGKSLWYKFNYRAALRAQDRTPIYLTLVNGNNSGVEFMVYTSDQAIDDLPDGIENWRAEIPTGRGTAQHLTCGSHIPKPSGECVSNDLTWVGTFAM